MGHYSTRNDGPPSWFVFLLGIALIFSAYYLWANLREFMRVGGLSIAEATRQAEVRSTSTREAALERAQGLPTRRPTSTPRPECIDYEVIAPSGNLRNAPSTLANLVESIPQGTILCVVGSELGQAEFVWYLVDTDPITRRIEIGYIREDIVRPLIDSTDTPQSFPTVTPRAESTNTPEPDEEETEETSPTPRMTNTPRTFPSVTPMPEPSRTPPGIGI